MPKKFSRIISITVILAIAAPFLASAATTTAKTAPLIYGAWIPYWKQQGGAQDMSLVLDKFREVSPFSYEVRNNGKTLKDDLGLDQGFWPAWLSAVHDAGIKIMPTVAWFDGAGIQYVLSNKSRRITHENAVVNLVKAKNFDGIDIDYESKLTKTRDYFSTFLYGLAIRLHPLGKKLACTIESRTPLDSIYRVMPTSTVERANNYVAINQYCDEVRVMAYDQGLIDLKLDDAKAWGTLYAPVADPEWVTKVLKEALKYISPKKIMLSVPTYGYEYQVTWANGQTKYERLRTHTFEQAMDRADMFSATPVRNSAGELEFAYTTSTLVTDISQNLTWYVSSTLPAAIASSTAQGGYTRFVSFSDAQSALGKIKLAKKYGLKGVYFFKMDGEADPALWGELN